MIELPELNNSSGGAPSSSDEHLIIAGAPTANDNDVSNARIMSFKRPALRFLIGSACVVSASFLAASILQGSSGNAAAEMEASASSASRATDLHFDWETHQPLSFHQSGFGALNMHHHHDESQFRRYLAGTNVVIPKSAVPHATPSLGEPNILNLWGHYVHDEHRSPFSSLLYDRPKEELHQEQIEYTEKMEQIRKEWGFWTFKDHSSEVRPVQKFDTVQYKDLNNKAWQTNVWQKDEKYTKDLIEEGRKLIDRMREAIYAEVGYPTKKKDGSTITDEERAIRDEKFKVHVSDDVTPKKTDYPEGVVYISSSAIDALARKLLHGMMTNDEFYFVLGGHSAAAGHGNDTFQQKTRQFHHIMEPVFQKLGMRLISRNLAMGGLGTTHFSMGQKELYGEKDFLMWDSMMTEKGQHEHELFNRQALLNGERVPILFTMVPYDLETETGGKAWIGDVIPTLAALPLTTSEEQSRTLPWAVQFSNCAPDVAGLCGGRGMDKYNAKCWEPRKDVLPKSDRMVNAQPGGQASWHPGWRDHQFRSRQVALLFLQAFDKAFDVWDEGMKTDGFPLNEKYWHVGSIYKDIQKTFSEYIAGPGKGTSACEIFYEKFNVEPKFCYKATHGMGQFSPVNLGQQNSVMYHAKKGANGMPKPLRHALYQGPDVMGLNFKVPKGEVDVHAIAIATNYEAPQLDHLWKDEGDDDEVEEDAEASRRWLRDEHDRNSSSNVKRETSESTIVPGEGWGSSWPDSRTIEGYCDGSSNSECGRTYDGNACLIATNNDGRETISGDATSGWLVINVPNVKEGFIYGKLEYWHPRDNWVTPTDEKYMNDPLWGGRKLGGYVKPFPDDFFFDVAVNGKIVAEYNKTIFDGYIKESSYNEAYYPFVNDASITGDVELAIRTRSESDPKGAALSVTHIYWI